MLVVLVARRKQWSGGGEEGSGRLSCILAKRVVWLVRRVEGVG